MRRIVEDLKDESEQYRKMVMEAIEKILANLGAGDIDQALEELVRIKIREARFRDTSESTHMSAPVRPLGP